MSLEAQKQKQIIIDEIKGKLENAQAAVVVDYQGITVAQADAMRKKLREANVDYTVYKNTLVKRAIEGTVYAGLADVLDGPSALAISTEDATAPARVLNEIIKDFKKMELRQVLLKVLSSIRKVSRQLLTFQAETFWLLSSWAAFSPQLARQLEPSRQSQMLRLKLNNKPEIYKQTKLNTLTQSAA
jgi:ribosomal protein L10